MEGKWFANSLEGAKRHGSKHYPNGKFRLVEVDIPDNARSLFTDANLDGFGPARFVDDLDLPTLMPRPLE